MNYAVVYLSPPKFENLPVLVNEMYAFASSPEIKYMATSRPFKYHILSDLKKKKKTEGRLNQIGRD